MDAWVLHDFLIKRFAFSVTFNFQDLKKGQMFFTRALGARDDSSTQISGDGCPKNVLVCKSVRLAKFRDLDLFDRNTIMFCIFGVL